jgi:iron complex outermembrane recepter protein
MTKKNQAIWLLVPGALCAAICSPAFAAPVATPNEATPQSEVEADARIAEIIVTARRRQESLQSTPVTVTAFNDETLRTKGINDFSRLAQATPGINFDTFPKAAPRPVFRGVGSSNQGAGSDPSSVAFLDGVYLGRASMLGIDFYDMERIEVLKGPQGTLWGKNVVAGAINFITAKPQDEAEASARLTFGEYGQTNGNLMLNAPLTDWLAARVVLGAISNQGTRKTVDGRALDDENKLSARLQLRAQLGTETTLLLSGDVANQDLSESSRFNLIRQPFTPGRGFADLADTTRSNPDHPGFTKSRTGGLRGELTTGALGFADWTTTVSWRTLDYDFANDLDGTNPVGNLALGVPVSGIQVLAKEHADSYSVESRLASRHSGPLTWVMGVYYNRDEVYRERESQQSATPTTINRFFGDSTNDSYAVFGEGQYALGGGLRVFAGGRYTKEKKVYAAKRLTGPLAAPITSYDTATSPGVFDKGVFTYRVGADWRMSDNVFAFATLSTGFKAGAFPEQPPSATLARIPTVEERATNYEVGLKTDWFDRRLRANISAFQMDYRDFQSIKVVPDASGGPAATRVVVDTSDATVKGIETEFVVAPVSWFDATVRYSYLHPYFTRFIQTARFLADGSPVFVDGKGNRLSRTPKHAVVADVAFTTPKEADWGWLRLGVTMDYQSDIFDNNINDFAEYRKARTLWDASLTYNLDDSFSVQAWVHNLSDVKYRTWQTNNNGVYHIVQYAPPRQFGISLDKRF